MIAKAKVLFLAVAAMGAGCDGVTPAETKTEVTFFAPPARAPDVGLIEGDSRANPDVMQVLMPSEENAALAIGGAKKDNSLQGNVIVLPKDKRAIAPASSAR